MPPMPKLESAIPVLPSFDQIKKKSLIENDIQATKKDTNSQADVQAINTKEVSFEEIKKCISEFSELCKTEGKMIEFAILSENNFSLNENTIQLQLQNELEANQLGQFKSKLQDFIKSKTSHLFQINYKIEEKTATKTLYSSTDKYNYIKEIYPEIEELKRRLGLEIEH